MRAMLNMIDIICSLLYNRLDQINDKSTNATGVVEARILLKYVVKIAEKRPELHNARDIYNTCKLMAPECGLSARDQKRALARIQSML